jgi:hypothetical protein
VLLTSSSKADFNDLALELAKRLVAVPAVARVAYDLRRARYRDRMLRKREFASGNCALTVILDAAVGCQKAVGKAGSN